MPEITSALVKELREKTGAGMMDCKKALTETNGDLDAAIDVLRRKGEARFVNLHDRETNEGRIGVYVTPDRKSANIVEVNCETDFVAMNEQFVGLVNTLAKRISPGSMAEVGRVAAVLGENINLQRSEIIDVDPEESPNEEIFSYVHGNGRIGVLVVMEGADEELGRDIAMHIAAAAPEYLDTADVPEAVIERERQFILSQPDLASKPPKVQEKMVEGRLAKFLAGIVLTQQPFVKDPGVRVGIKVATSNVGGATINRFVRYELGK